jgi:hypothetical protein
MAPMAPTGKPVAALLLLALLAIGQRARAAGCPDVEVDLELVAADDASVSFCQGESCWRVALADGSYRPFARPGDAAETYPPFQATSNDDGVRRVLGAKDGQALKVQEVKTGKSVEILPDGKLRPRRPGGRAEPPRCYVPSLLDGIVLVEQSECAEEGQSRILFFDPVTARRIGILGGPTPVGTWGTHWVHLRDHVWAFNSDDGQVVLQDVRSGKVLAHHRPRDLFGAQLRHRAMSYLFLSGEWLVVVAGPPAAGTVTLIDRRSGKIGKRYQSRCAGR